MHISCYLDDLLQQNLISKKVPLTLIDFKSILSQECHDSIFRAMMTPPMTSLVGKTTCNLELKLMIVRGRN